MKNYQIEVLFDLLNTKDSKNHFFDLQLLIKHPKYSEIGMLDKFDKNIYKSISIDSKNNEDSDQLKTLLCCQM